tara:strand:- start:31765 stop:32499 length:735 start_codon:yes stop_codon:yes gene_type:complete
MGNRVIGLSLALSSCLSLVACGGATKGKGATDVTGIDSTDGLTVPRVDPSLCDTKGKKVTTFDLNHDNQPDVWKLYATANEGGTTVEILTCKQVDLDHDGKKDYVQTYSRTGEMVAEEFDFTFEGEMDAREHYDRKTGKIYLIERDSDHDKKPDVWEKYDEEGLLESVRRDRNADGKPDLWEQYKKGVLLAILYDDDFDNKVDRKDELKTEKPPKTEAAPTEEDPDSIENDSPDDEEGGDETAE